MAGQIGGVFLGGRECSGGWADTYTGSEDMIVGWLCGGVMWLEKLARRLWAEREEVVSCGREVVVFVAAAWESVGRDMLRRGRMANGRRILVGTLWCCALSRLLPFRKQAG